METVQWPFVTWLHSKFFLFFLMFFLFVSCFLSFCKVLCLVFLNNLLTFFCFCSMTLYSFGLKRLLGDLADRTGHFASSWGKPGHERLRLLVFSGMIWSLLGQKYRALKTFKNPFGRRNMTSRWNWVLRDCRLEPSKQALKKTKKTCAGRNPLRKDGHEK